MTRSDVDRHPSERKRPLYHDDGTRPEMAQPHAPPRSTRTHSPPLGAYDQQNRPVLPPIREMLSPPQTPSHHHTTLSQYSSNNHPARATLPGLKHNVYAQQSISGPESARSHHPSYSRYGQQTPPRGYDSPPEGRTVYDLSQQPSGRRSFQGSLSNGHDHRNPLEGDTDIHSYTSAYSSVDEAGTHYSYRSHPRHPATPPPAPAPENAQYGIPKRGRPPARRPSPSPRDRMFHQDSYFEVREAHSQAHPGAHTHAHPSSRQTPQHPQPQAVQYPAAYPASPSAYASAPAYHTPQAYIYNIPSGAPLPTVVYPAPISGGPYNSHAVPHGYSTGQPISPYPPHSSYTFHSPYPNSGRDPLDPRTMPPKRRGNLPKPSTDILKGWLEAHKDQPYPTDEEKHKFAQMTNLNLNQISNWFINARRRNLPRMKHRDAQSANGRNGGGAEHPDANGAQFAHRPSSEHEDMMQH